jgi:hypothetical protein
MRNLRNRFVTVLPVRWLFLDVGCRSFILSRVEVVAVSTFFDLTLTAATNTDARNVLFESPIDLR